VRFYGKSAPFCNDDEATDTFISPTIEPESEEVIEVQ
jgi:hypothetical protein